MKTIVKTAGIAVHLVITCTLIATGAIAFFCIGFGIISIIGAIAASIL